MIVVLLMYQQLVQCSNRSLVMDGVKLESWHDWRASHSMWSWAQINRASLHSGPFQPSENRSKNRSKILSQMNQKRSFFGRFSGTVGITSKNSHEKYWQRIGWERKSHGLANREKCCIAQHHGYSQTMAVCFAWVISVHMILTNIYKLMMALLMVFVSCSYDNQSKSYRVSKTLARSQNDGDDDPYYRPEYTILLV